MKNYEEITKYVKENNKNIQNLTLIEKHLYLVLSDIVKQFNNGRLTSEQTIKLKNMACSQYEAEAKDLEGKIKTYEEYIENIKKTEMLRAEYRKNKNLETANKLIELYSGEKF